MMYMLTCLQHRVYSVCFSADGKFIASGSKDETVKVWSVGSSGDFECQSTLTGHTRYVPVPALLVLKIVCSLSSDAQFCPWRLLRQDGQEAGFVQRGPNYHGVGRDNRGAHWLAPDRAHRVRTCSPLLCSFSKSFCLLTIQRCAALSGASGLTRAARSLSQAALTRP